MSNIQKETEEYKNSSKSKLKKMIFFYKTLIFFNNEIFNFIFTLCCFFIPYLIFSGISTFNVILGLVVHYLFFWRFLYKKKNFKIVSDEDKYEMEEVVLILKTYLKNKTSK